MGLATDCAISPASTIMHTTALALVALLHGSLASASTGRTCTGPQTWAASIAELTDASTYDKNMRPTLALQPTVEADAGVVAPPDELKVQLFITSVTLIDGKNSVFGLAGYQRQYWKDERLAYSNTTEGGCFDEINVGEGDWGGLWMPDTYSDNSLKVQLGENLLFIYPDGSIWLSQRFVQQYECKMNFAQMPVSLAAAWHRRRGVAVRIVAALVVRPAPPRPTPR